ncbi:MAG: hypothetical protein ACP5OA_05240 [Candidatus Woesearchaeota archaeon]
MVLKGPIFESKDSVKETKAEKLLYKCFESDVSHNKNNKSRVHLKKPTTAAKKFKEWSKMRKEFLDNIDILETYKAMLHDMDDALYFSKNSYAQKPDLVKVLNKIKTIENKKKIVSIKDLEKELKYNKAQLRILLEKLKMLGEIFDPYTHDKQKAGKYVRCI